MISYIVASHDRAVLESNLLATLLLQDGDELLIQQDPPSIAVAYNEGTAEAKHPVRCYVHQDVQIIESSRLRAELLEYCTAEMGMVGVVGNRDRAVPWWTGQVCGSVVDTRIGLVDFGPGGECAYLDGLLLATAQPVKWDESIPGFHFYDHDVCEQMLARGLLNWCLDGGAEMVRHNTVGLTDRSPFDDSGARFREKWAMS